MRVAQIPRPYKDVDDLLRSEDGDAKYEAMIRGALPAPAWMIDKLDTRHDLATIEDHFALAIEALEPVFDKLAALDGVVVNEHDRKGARLTFTRPGNAFHAWWTNTVIGSARLTPTRLIVSTNS